MPQPGFPVISFVFALWGQTARGLPNPRGLGPAWEGQAAWAFGISRHEWRRLVKSARVAESRPEWESLQPQRRWVLAASEELAKAASSEIQERGVAFAGYEIEDAPFEMSPLGVGGRFNLHAARLPLDPEASGAQEREIWFREYAHAVKARLEPMLAADIGRVPEMFEELWVPGRATESDLRSSGDANVGSLAMELAIYSGPTASALPHVERISAAERTRREAAKIAKSAKSRGAPKASQAARRAL